MKRSIVRYITNGYEIINYEDPGLQALGELHYGISVSEAIYWVSGYLDPPPQGSVPLGLPGPFVPTDHAVKATDPLMNQEAHIGPVSTGGFIVRELPHRDIPGRPQLDEYCPTMDAVHDLLVIIFTPPP